MKGDAVDDKSQSIEVAATGITGLDYILRGGFPRHRLYLIQGDPGVGKTTLALQFLLNGAKSGERGLYVTLSESRDELESIAKSHEWDLSTIDIFELPIHETSEDAENTIFHPAEVELSETTRMLLEAVERSNPQRVVFDSLSEIRLLAQNAFRYRKQILALKNYFGGRKMTVLLLDDRTTDLSDRQLHSVPHGVVELEQLSPEYGAERRRLNVVKIRGLRFRGGYHDFTIRTGGLVVFPRLVAAEHRHAFQLEPLPSGSEGIDNLLGGGLDRGTSTLIMGPAGSGKSVIAAQYAHAAAVRNEHASLFVFEENPGTLFRRSEALGIDLQEDIDRGYLTMQQVDPAEMTPGEFAQNVRDAVEKRDSRVIVIDSLNGYLNAMPAERFLTLHMHELLSYLAQRGVATILVVAQHGLLGSAMQTPVDVSYLADTVLLLRFFEAKGEIRKAISVLKKRSGKHDTAIRELYLGRDGLSVGEQLKDYHGILTGTPGMDPTFAGEMNGK